VTFAVLRRLIKCIIISNVLVAGMGLLDTVIYSLSSMIMWRGGGNAVVELICTRFYQLNVLCILLIFVNFMHVRVTHVPDDGLPSWRFASLRHGFLITGEKSMI